MYMHHMCISYTSISYVDTICCMLCMFVCVYIYIYIRIRYGWLDIQMADEFLRYPVAVNTSLLVGHLQPQRSFPLLSASWLEVSEWLGEAKSYI